MRVKLIGLSLVMGGLLGLASMPSWAESNHPVVLDDQALAEIDGGFGSDWNGFDSRLLGTKEHVIGSLKNAVHTVKSRLGPEIDSFEDLFNR